MTHCYFCTDDPEFPADSMAEGEECEECGRVKTKLSEAVDQAMDRIGIERSEYVRQSARSVTDLQD